MNHLIQLNQKARQSFWCFTIALMGSLTLLGMPAVSIHMEWQEAMLLAKSYQVDEVDARKEQVEDSSSQIERKAKRVASAQPSWMSAPFVSRLVWNDGADLLYTSSMVAHHCLTCDHLIVPLGSMAPPVIVA